VAETTCSRGHRIGDGATTPGPHEPANVYRYRDGRRACLRCTRAQWRRQWQRKAVARG
jgi:hypothetical protein